MLVAMLIFCSHILWDDKSKSLEAFNEEPLRLGGKTASEETPTLGMVCEHI